VLLICCAQAGGIMSKRERLDLRDQAREMFMHGYRNYITQVSTPQRRRADAPARRHTSFCAKLSQAFPKDELKPLSCKGEDSFGGVQLTLIDSLDTLAVVGDAVEFERASRYLGAHLTMDCAKSEPNCVCVLPPQGSTSS